MVMQQEDSDGYDWLGRSREGATNQGPWVASAYSIT